MNCLILQFPDKNFRLEPTLMSVSELWQELARFTAARHKDNIVVEESGCPYPLSTRSIQMPGFVVLSECLTSTHKAMQQASEAYLRAFRSGFTGDFVRQFLSELTENDSAAMLAVQSKFFGVLESRSNEWRSLFLDRFATEASALTVISALEQLAANLDLVRDNAPTYF